MTRWKRRGSSSCSGTPSWLDRTSYAGFLATVIPPHQNSCWNRTLTSHYVLVDTRGGFRILQRLETASGHIGTDGSGSPLDATGSRTPVSALF